MSDVILTPRPADGPMPGDLYLDSAVPECERVSLSRNGWSAQVTHVWTGTGWTRLVPGTVREVPAHPAVTIPAPARAASRSVRSPRRAASGQAVWRSGPGGAARLVQLDAWQPVSTSS